MDSKGSSSKTSTSTRKKKSRSQAYRQRKETQLKKLNYELEHVQRVLHKENLPADVRIKMQRKHKFIEEKMTPRTTTTPRAPPSGREKPGRDHKLKFFERRKVSRSIKQKKKELDPASTSTKELEELRIDLNYILHFPPSERYISLFSSTSGKGKKPTDQAAVERRDELRHRVRSLMETGELSNEPEVEVEGHHSKPGSRLLSDDSEPRAGGQRRQPDDQIDEDDFFDAAGSEDSREE